MEPSIEDVANGLREQCKALEVSIRRMVDHGVYQGEQAFVNQHGEMKAQTMLAVRHLEDARMRLGKICQYAGNGINDY
jgi:hypothetical protein